MRLAVGNDFIETHVGRDPVSLRWEWRGYTDVDSERELHDTEEAATDAARHWAFKQSQRRMCRWTTIVTALEDES